MILIPGQSFSQCTDGNCEDGYGVLVSKQGDFYCGYFLDGKYNGEGILLSHEKKFVYADFKAGKPHGKALVYDYESGDKMLVHYNNGEFQGTGVIYSEDNPPEYFLYTDGKAYDYTPNKHLDNNLCVNGDCKNGYGQMLYSSGDVYEGNFLDGLPHGEGIMTDSNGVFNGCFWKYYQNGYGELTLKDGTKRTGLWDKGRYVSELNTKSMMGCVSGDCQNGYGVSIDFNGSIYKGYFRNGIAHGHGKSIYKTGFEIDGAYEDSGLNGFASVTYPENSETVKHFGFYSRNQAHGYGAMFYKTGIYIGQFEHGNTVGEGVFLNYETGNKLSGVFNGGKLITEISEKELKPLFGSNNGLGVKFLTEGRYYGYLKDGVPEGRGVLLKFDGTIITGKFSGGEYVDGSDIAMSKEQEIESGSEISESISEVSSVKRLALVIGNGSYKHVPNLANPVNDAALMTKTLRELGFEVMPFTNLDRRAMCDKIYDFGDKLTKQKGVGLFYYAGHGLQVNGINYLVPVAATVDRADEIDDECVSLEKVLGQMDYAGNELNIIILDACRNNPFASVRAISNDGGLAQINAPKGTFVAYATAPGKTASDGKGNNGLYTEQLVKALKTKGLTLENVFKKVRNEVYNKSKEIGMEQIPWENSSVFGDFYFNK